MGMRLKEISMLGELEYADTSANIFILLFSFLYLQVDQSGFKIKITVLNCSSLQGSLVSINNTYCVINPFLLTGLNKHADSTDISISS